MYSLQRQHISFRIFKNSIVAKTRRYFLFFLYYLSSRGNNF